MSDERIRAIPTAYNGYKFRSRLEARWAVFLDALDVPYVFEPEGFEIEHSGGGAPVRYLPDFWLPRQECWLEIKGQEPGLEERVKAQLLATGTGHPLHMLFGSVQAPTVYRDEAWPAPPDGTWTFYPGELGEDPGDGIGDIDAVWTECIMYPAFRDYARGHPCGTVGLVKRGNAQLLPCSCDSPGIRQGAATPRLLKAYTAARSHRFGIW